MNPFRAKRIADNLANIGSFHVRNYLNRLEVSYRDQRANFDSEDAFWSFIFKLAQANHEEGLLADIEARLQA